MYSRFSYNAFKSNLFLTLMLVLVFLNLILVQKISTKRRENDADYRTTNSVAACLSSHCIALSLAIMPNVDGFWGCTARTQCRGAAYRYRSFHVAWFLQLCVTMCIEHNRDLWKTGGTDRETVWQQTNVSSVNLASLLDGVPDPR